MTGGGTAAGSARLRAVPSVLGEAIRLTWRADRRTFIIAALWQATGALSLAALILVGQWVLAEILAVSEGRVTVRQLLPAVAALAAVTAMSSASSAFQQQHQRFLTEQTSQAVWSQVLDVSGRVSLEAFESPNFFDRLQRVENNAVMQPANVATSLFGLMSGAAGTVVLLGALLTVEPMLVPLLLVAGIPAVLLSRQASRTEYAFATRMLPVYRRRDYLRRLLTGRHEAKEVRAFGVEAGLRERHDQVSHEFVTALRSQVRKRQRFAAAVTVVNVGALSLTLLLLVWMVAGGRVTVPAAAAAALGIRLVSSRLEQLFRATGTLIEASAFLADLADFLKTPTEPVSASRDTTVPLERDVVLEDVHYTYPEAATPALRGASMILPRGKVIALVGENGSGKTTLAKIVAGLYPPTQGHVRWDGQDARGLEPAVVRRSVAVIFQDFVRYQLTALENIALTGPGDGFDRGKVRQAARRVGAADFLERLPRGYDTLLGKEFADGVDLSVGQWQRVALARALFRDAPLVVLDEPTAALDPRAEHALFDDVRTLLGGRTALLISHRFSSVRSADFIYVMKDGRIFEAGDHDTLMARGGLYRELFTLQASAYLEAI